MIRLKLGDLEGARALVTPKLKPLGSKLEVTQKIINLFAEASGDHNSIHVDPMLASAGKTIAHGFLAVSRVPSLIPELDPFRIFEDATCQLLRSAEEYKLPIRVGRSISCHGRVASVEPDGQGLRVVFEWKILIDERMTAVEGTFTLLYRKLKKLE